MPAPLPEPEPTRAAGAIDASALSAAAALLRSCQVRPTPIRMLVLAVLQVRTPSDGLMNPPDICRAILATGHATIVPTIYNVLSTLTDHGLAHRIRLGDRPAMYGAGPAATSLTVLMCESCDEVRTLFSPQIHAELQALAARRGFTMGENHLVLRGRCAACSAPAGQRDLAGRRR